MRSSTPRPMIDFEKKRKWHPMDNYKAVFCRVLTNHTRGIYPGYYPTKDSCKFCKAFIPVPGTSVSSVRPCHNTRSTGTAFSYLPGTSASSVCPCHTTRNFCEFCNFYVSVPGTSVSAVRTPYPYPELL